MRTILFLILALPILAQVPTISGIVVPAATIQPTSVRIVFDVTPVGSDAWACVGTVSGTYTSGCGYAIVATNTTPAGRPAFAIANLTPGTAYFIRPFAAPNLGDNVNICNANVCGSLEQTFTTPAETTANVMPTLPSVYAAPYPDVSGYPVVPIVHDPSGDCASSATVGPVSMGMLMQAVINAEAANGGPFRNLGAADTICREPAGAAPFGPGYIATQRAMGYTGYIVFDTAGIFPPYGVRIDPTSCLHCMTWIATAQPTTSGLLGGVFTSDYLHTGSQGYILRHVILQTDQTINTGRWSFLVSFGNNGEYGSDDNAIEQCVILGAPTGDTYGAIQYGSGRLAVVDSYIAQIHSSTNFALGIYLLDGGIGPFTYRNNFMEAYGLQMSAEGFGGAACAASDVTVIGNTFYQNFANLNNMWLVRNGPEIKCGHRWNFQGNTFDGSWVYQNSGPAIYISGTNNSDTTGTYGVSDITIKYNLFTNVSTVFDVLGSAAADNGPGANPPVTQRVLLQHNLAYNIGYAGRIAAGAGGGGLVNSYIIHRPGSAYVTMDHNTFGVMDNTDTRGLVDFIPAYFNVGGGDTLASRMKFTNNIAFLNVSAAGLRGVFLDESQLNNFRPRLPAITSGTPQQILDTFSVQTTNSTNVPNYSWANNYNVCAQINGGGNTWTQMSNGQCTTYQTNMPQTALDTWQNPGTAVFASIPQNNYRFTGPVPTYAKSDVGGGAPGADIDALEAALGLIQQVRPTDITASGFTISATVGSGGTNCYVGYGTSNNPTNWAYTTADTSPTRNRSIAVTGLTTKTAYYYAFGCAGASLSAIQVTRTQ